MLWQSLSKILVIPYTLFGLPWLIASMALVFADPLTPPEGGLTLKVVFWMVLATLSARAAGMSFNRLIDQQFDARNPRTQDRPLVTGELSSEQVRRVAWGSVGLFLVACGMLSTTCLLLAPVLVALLWGYSYLKRVTSWCHLVMALNHALIPVFVWAAISDKVTIPAIFLGTAILALFTANDIIYGIQDERFDREEGLHSVATALGAQPALWIAFALHTFFIWFLVDVALVMQLTPLFYVGIGLASLLLLLFDRQVDIQEPKTINTFLFRANTWVGFVLMFFSVASVVWLKLL